MTAVILMVVVAFAAGSFPTGVLVARVRGVDLRKVGSGNVGATNVGRALGKGWAVLVLLVDAFKGWAPTIGAARLRLPPLAIAAVAAAAVLGHVFSVFLKGRGGKGVATSLGSALALTPVATLVCAGLFAVLFAVFRIASIGSLAAVVAYPLVLLVLGDRQPAHYAFALVMAAVVVLRHRENIRRLARGEEHRA
jgi:glycerol-3-phosphate acyltransferase PlsY